MAADTLFTAVSKKEIGRAWNGRRAVSTCSIPAVVGTRSVRRLCTATHTLEETVKRSVQDEVLILPSHFMRIA